MSEQQQTKIAIIGCGNIAGPYVKDLQTYPEIALMGVADLDQPRAEEFASDNDTTAYPGVDALLADPEVQLVVNLTIPKAHKPVIIQALNAGKHVYSEKPLATNYADAAELVALAKDKGLRLACSPFTGMGEAQQTAWKMIREGKLGEVRVVFSEVNWGRIEAWHPAPQSFYEVGPLYDVGVYSLTIMTTIFGPVKRATAYGTVLMPDRKTTGGDNFRVTTPDFMVAMLEFANGAVARLTTDFYAGTPSTNQVGMEFHGDAGSLSLDSWIFFNSGLKYADFGKEFEPVELVRPGFDGLPWGRGVWETATAIMYDRPHRFTGEQAAHIVEVLEATAASASTSQTVEVHSTFPQPAPMDWAI